MDSISGNGCVKKTSKSEDLIAKIQEIMRYLLSCDHLEDSCGHCQLLLLLNLDSSYKSTLTANVIAVFLREIDEPLEAIINCLSVHFSYLVEEVNRQRNVDDNGNHNDDKRKEEKRHDEDKEGEPCSHHHRQRLPRRDILVVLNP